MFSGRGSGGMDAYYNGTLWASRVCNPRGAHTANLGPPPSPYPQSSPRVPAVDRLRAAQISSASRIGLPTQAPISAPLPLIF